MREVISSLHKQIGNSPRICMYGCRKLTVASSFLQRMRTLRGGGRGRIDGPNGTYPK